MPLLNPPQPPSEAITPAIPHVISVGIPGAGDHSSMRDWQLDAKDNLIRVKASGRINFLACACPGAGKTRFALEIARSMLATGEVERISIVVPSCHLKTQWARSGQQNGLRLTAQWENDASLPEQGDTHGTVLTYAQIASFPEASRIHCARRRTLVILDEIHHCGSGRTWGDALRNAFEPAAFRLLLSGTPFRSDESHIPFVAYEDGRSRPDYTYGYGAALRDNVCRPVVFPSFEGRMEWMEGDDTVEATFADDIDEQQVSRRLRTALDPSGDWLGQVLRAADRRLGDIRANGHAEAGGLIVAMDQRHAQAIGQVLRRVTGIVPAIATSDDPDASAIIERFRQSNDRWIVAVKMVSEGVDVPRLRVGVYASNVVSELFVRQWVGRFVRVQSELVTDDGQFAYAFLPKDERLISIVSAIQEERDHVLAERRDSAQDAGTSGTQRRVGSMFIPMASEAHEDDVYAQGQVYPQALMAQARLLQSQSSPLLQRIPDVAIAELLRLTQPAVVDTLSNELADVLTGSDAGLPSARAVPVVTYDEENRRLRSAIVQLANRVARTNCILPEEVHRSWFERSGVAQRHATNAQLRQKFAWLNALEEGTLTLPRQTA